MVKSIFRGFSAQDSLKQADGFRFYSFGDACEGVDEAAASQVLWSLTLN